MLGNGDKRGIEDGALGGRGQIARQQQPEMVGEVDAADQLIGEITSTHHDDALV